MSMQTGFYAHKTEFYGKMSHLLLKCVNEPSLKKLGSLHTSVCLSWCGQLEPDIQSCLSQRWLGNSREGLIVDNNDYTSFCTQLTLFNYENLKQYSSGKFISKITYSLSNCWNKKTT